MVGRAHTKSGDIEAGPDLAATSEYLEGQLLRLCAEYGKDGACLHKR
jgi:hypothetical protein